MKLSDQSSNEEKKTGEKRNGKEKPAKEKLAEEKTTKERTAKERTAKDKTTKDKMTKDKMTKDKTTKDKTRFQIKKSRKDLGFKKFRKDAGEGRARANKNILRLTYAFSTVFVLMAGYLGWFIQFKSENVIGNSYNARLDQFADRIIRGSIMSSDKTVLAETRVSQDGTETRYYPFDYLFVHSVGYSGLNGKTGIESLANFYLLSSHVNLLEKVINELRGEKNLGDNVVTTLNLNLQKVASDALGGNRGAVIAMEPDTGKILCMVSQPNFNANLVDEKWQELIDPDNTKAQLVNRATQGLYPPGSTFKIVTALEYIRENPSTWQDFTFNCDGSYQTGEYTIKCYHSEAHGQQNLIQAFANSCNGAFAEIGLGLNPDSFHALADQLLFNSSLPYALPYNQSSFTMTGGADDWEKLQTSIGQGKTQITPLHNLLIVSAIANGGTLMKPYMVDHVENVGGQTVKKFLPSSGGSPLSATDAQMMAELMKSVVDFGTGSALRGASYSVAGKTGSAEFETGKETHSWFVGYAPADNPKIAISVIAEEAGSGGKVAAPIARAVFDAYLGK